MFYWIIILLLIAQLLSGCSNYINRIYKTNTFAWLLMIACIASVVSTLFSFSTMYFLGKTQNVIILQCMLIIGSVISVLSINTFLIKEPVHTGSYITLFAIVAILIFHHVATMNFYSKAQKAIKLIKLV